MAQLVTIFGGSGFVGRYVARRMAKAGWRIRVVTRDPSESAFVRTYGVVGQVEPVFGNIRDEATTRAAIHGADAVINCVSSRTGRGKNDFATINVAAAERIARLSAELGVARLVHLSDIGADAESPSEYDRSKAEGEAAVLRHFPAAVILRPAAIFGVEDRLFNLLGGIPGPILPVTGGDHLLQPVWVDDVAEAAEAAATLPEAAGVYELGGPEQRSLRQLAEFTLAETRRRKLIISLPAGLARAVAGAMSLANRLSLGIVPAPVSPDQVLGLSRNRVVAEGARGLADLGVSATDMAAITPGYLWRFRNSGQFLAIKESARNLKA